jgi:hypothetical protein
MPHFLRSITIDRPTSPDETGLLLLLMWLVVAVFVLVVVAEDEEDVDDDADDVEAVKERVGGADVGGWVWLSFRLLALFDVVDVGATLSVCSGGGRFFPLGGWLMEYSSEEDEEEEVILEGTGSANTSMFHTGTAI